VIHFASIAALLVAPRYRFGAAPERRRPWITPGAAPALTLRLLASVLLTFYIEHIATFGVICGALRVVVTVMLSFFVTASAVLPGAELNERLERLSADLSADPTALVPQVI
jgi:membrane protein